MEKKPFYHSPEARDYKTNDKLRKILENSGEKIGNRWQKKEILDFSQKEVAKDASKETRNWLLKKGVKPINLIRDKDIEEKTNQVIGDLKSDQRPARLVAPDEVEELPSDEILAEILDQGEENSQKPPKHQFSRN